MYRDLSVAAVVPAYNEEKLIGTVITTMPDYVDHIVVDDCSTGRHRRAGAGDGRPAGHAHPARREHRRRWRDHRPATQALELGADINVVMAGDGQMDPDYLPDLLDPIVDGGSVHEGQPLLLLRLVPVDAAATGSSATCSCRS